MAAFGLRLDLNSPQSSLDLFPPGYKKRTTNDSKFDYITTNFKYSGFDKTGQYCTMLQYCEMDLREIKARSNQIASYWYEEDKLEKALIILDTQDMIDNFKEIFYDFYSNRWFVMTFVSSEELNADGPLQWKVFLRLYSGSLQNKLKTHGLSILVGKNFSLDFEQPRRVVF